MTTPTPASSRSTAALFRVLLLAALTVLALEQIRASGPLLSRSFDEGTVTVLLTALGTYLLPGLLAWGIVLLARRVPGGGLGRQTVRGTIPGRPALSFQPAVTGLTVLVATIALAIARIAMQATSGEARFWIGLLAVAVAVTTLTLAVALVGGGERGQVETIVGLSLGTALALACQWALSGWDSVWRGGALGWTRTLVLAVLAVVFAAVTRRSQARAQLRGLGWLGPWLALDVMILANAPFAASQAGTSLAIGSGALILASGVTALLLARGILASVPGIVLALVLPAAIAGVFYLPGVLSLVAAVLAVPAAAVALTRALTPTTALAPSVRRIAVAAGVAGIATIVPLLVYQLDYDVPLHIPNGLVIVALAALASFAGWRLPLPAPEATAEATTGANATQPAIAIVQTPGGVSVRRLSDGLALAGIVALGLGFALPPAAANAGTDTTAPASLRLVSWNLHYGVGAGPDVDLEQVARTIEAERPDVVALQEVERGWILGGGADMATYLSRRLGMPFVYAPAADRQFGNVILSSRPLTDVTALELPYGSGPQKRSAISATVVTGNGPVRVTSVHLQHREANTATRVLELAELLRSQPSNSPTVVAGDLNAIPGSPEIAALTEAHYESAQDAVGDPNALTSPADVPVQRIDWIFGSRVSWTDFSVLDDASSSDHRGLAVTVTVPAGS